jgi:hypothetical protein
MHFILSVAFLWVLPFSYFVIGDDSPIAAYVDKINLLVSLDKQQPHTVKFLKDLKNWTGLLENAVSIDREGVKEVVKEINRILSPVGPDSICEFSPGAKFVSQTPIEIYKFETTILNGFLHNLDEDSKVPFKFTDYIEFLIDPLTHYDAAYKDKSFDALFKFKKPIGDVAKPLSLAMKKFSSAKWEKEFYEKMKKAAENESSEGAVDKKGNSGGDAPGSSKGASGKKGNSGGTAPGPSGIDSRIFLAIAGIFILLIAGVVTFLALKRKGSWTFETRH